jgi:hypothetical protein
MTLETTDHKLVALDVREALDAEAELADMYRYNVSPLLRRLLRQATPSLAARVWRRQGGADAGARGAERRRRRWRDAESAKESAATPVDAEQVAASTIARAGRGERVSE